MRGSIRLTLAALAVLLGVIAARTLAPGPRPEPVEALVPFPLHAAGLAGRLAAALTYRTISWSRDAEPELAELERMHAFLARTFPVAHRTLERETVARGSLLYRWRGSEPSLPPAVFLAHLDVVPIEPGTEPLWTHPPFGGVVDDGFVWGRGAVDDKGSLMGLLEAAELLADTGFAPRRDLYLAFGHDEEVGGPHGAKAIATLLVERGVRPLFTLDEGMGIVGAGLLPGLERDVALIATAEKGFLTLTLIAPAEGGHSSRPPPVTAIGRLARALAALEAEPFAPAIEEPVSGMLDGVAEAASLPLRVVLRNRWLFDPLIRTGLLRVPDAAPLVRTTVAPTIFRAGIKDNVLPSRARATVNFRLRPGEPVEDAVEHVRRALDDPGIAIEVLEGRPATLPSSPESEGFRLVARTIRELSPDMVVAPMLSIGGTDSKHYEDIAEATLRFFPLRLSRDDAARIHGTDERIGVEAYAELVRFYVRVLENAGLPRRPSPAAS